VTVQQRLPRIDNALKHNRAAGTFSIVHAYRLPEDVMKSYFTNLPTRTWVLLVVPAVVIAYPIVRIVVPAVLHAVVPDVVRSVLSMI
jgi:hypothetical protein